MPYPLNSGSSEMASSGVLSSMLPKAEINPKLCINCGLCKQNCRFDAINFESEYKVNYYACEGCGVCEAICPVNAVSLNDEVAGELNLYQDNAIFSTAKLKMGSATSGKLVTEVKKQIKNDSVNYEIAIIDGSPGIGCPVIASISGVDMVLVVAEPSISGISDMERIIKTAEKFQVTTAICVNKYDTNIENTGKIEDYCKQYDYPFVGRIPFDKYAIKVINSKKSIVDIDCMAGTAVRDILKKTSQVKQNKKGYWNCKW